jgi:hypothetical protein
MRPDGRQMRSRVACGALLSKTSVLTEQKTTRLGCSRIAFRLHGDHRTLIRVGSDQFREMISGARHGHFSSHD